MRNVACSLLIIITVLCSGITGFAEDAASADDTAAATKATADNIYGDTYTPEELAAIDQALWAANMTRTDMTFKKDLTEGHGCFPVVKEMMHDPLTIAPWMDGMCAALGGSLGDSHETIHQVWFNSDSPNVWLGVTPGARISFTDADPLQVVDYLTESLIGSAINSVPAESLGQIRAEITESLAWHSFEDSSEETGYNNSKSSSQEELYQLLSTVDPLAQPADDLQSSYSIDMLNLMLKLEMVNSDIAGGNIPNLTEPYVVDTTIGRICIGTPGDDYYEGDFAVLIEPGGNDTYHNCRIGAAYGAPTEDLGNGQLGYFVDLGGDDFYDCADVNINLGAAVLGVAAFYDLGGGDDRYYAGSCTLGAAMGGIATFYDDGGSDYYSGKVYTMGAAGFGIGLMVDDSVIEAPVFDTAEGNDALIDSYATGESDVDTHNLMDNDTYTAWANAQAFARPRGIALCINKRGNEVYHAGGVYTDAPLFADRYQSFSQGFAIGERGIDWAGGIAMLIDYDGNDRYLGDIYNQGVGYWYGAGLLWDGGGNDTYEMTQYGQGSGIHLAVGGLVDVAGSDAYLMHSGLGQGSSHDLAVSIFHDRGGNDRYHGNTTCNGGSLTGSVSIFIDRSGDDTYAGRKNSLNYADTRRINIGLLIDTGGDDEYMGVMDDNTVWRQGNIGMGVDLDPPEPVAGGATSAPNEFSMPEDEIPIPEICGYEGELTQQVFDELWEIAVRWEVGDNRVIVPHARERLVEFGAAVVPYMSTVMDNSNSGLALRAYVDIFGKLLENDSAAVYACLDENAQSGEYERQRTVLYLIGEMKLVDLEHVVTGFFEQDDEALTRRAIGVLGSIGSHAADENLIDLLTAARSDELLLTAAMNTLTNLEVDCYGNLRPLLSHELLSVRGQLVKQLAAHWDAYGDAAVADLVQLIGNAGEPRAVRSLLELLVSVDYVPVDGELAGLMPQLLGTGDWGVRADAVRVVRHWEALMAEQFLVAPTVAAVAAAMQAMLADETDPFVLFAAGVE